MAPLLMKRPPVWFEIDREIFHPDTFQVGPVFPDDRWRQPNWGGEGQFRLAYRVAVPRVQAGGTFKLFGYGVLPLADRCFRIDGFFTRTNMVISRREGHTSFSWRSTGEVELMPREASLAPGPVGIALSAALARKRFTLLIQGIYPDFSVTMAQIAGETINPGDLVCLAHDGRAYRYGSFALQVPKHLAEFIPEILHREKEAAADPEFYGLVYVDWLEENGWSERAGELRGRAADLVRPLHVVHAKGKKC